MKETKQIPVGIPSFLNNIYRLLGYEDNSSRNSPESKQQYSSAFKELKKERFKRLNRKSRGIGGVIYEYF